MPELAGAVLEVDQPASQRDKRDRAAELPGPAPLFVPVDFGHDDLAGALEAAGHRGQTPTTWVWEGVVPYLSRPQVGATLAAVAARSAPGSRVVVNYQAPSLRARLGRLVARVAAGQTERANLWRDEPWRSTWTPRAMRALLTGNGFTVRSDDDLLTLAAALPMTIRQRGSLPSGRVAVADR